MSLTVMDYPEDSIFEDATLSIIEPAYEGYISVETYWGNYSFFYKSCNRINFNILVFTDDSDMCDRYLIGNADEIDGVMDLIDTAARLCVEARDVKAD